MNKKTDQSIDEQIAMLPEALKAFAVSQDWQKTLSDIALEYSLTEEQLDGVRLEVLFILIGLTHADALKDVLEHEVGIQGVVLEALVKSVEEKIFTPIRPALIEFFEKEAQTEALEASAVEENTEAPTEEEVARAANIFPKEILVATPTPPAPTRVWEKEPDVAPENLPIAEVAEPIIPLIPPIPPKNLHLEAKPLGWETPSATHPFEEKMKKVFTAGQQSMGELVIEETAPQAPTPLEPKAPPTHHIDPYREAIE